MKYMPTIRSGRATNQKLFKRFDDFFVKFERGYFDRQRELAERENEVLSSYVPDTEVEESEYEFLITANIPDLHSNEIHLDLEGDVLRIHGERHREATETSEEPESFEERAHGIFLRSFTIPESIDTNRIEARFKDGVLTVRLPKLDLTEPQDIKIN